MKDDFNKNEYYKEVGDAIGTLCDFYHLSQQELALKAQISPTTVSHIINASIRYKPEILRKIFVALGHETEQAGIDKAREIQEIDRVLLAKAILKERKLQRKKQGECGISTTYICDIEKGRDTSFKYIQLAVRSLTETYLPAKDNIDDLERMKFLIRKHYKPKIKEEFEPEPEVTITPAYDTNEKFYRALANAIWIIIRDRGYEPGLLYEKPYSFDSGLGLPTENPSQFAARWPAEHNNQREKLRKLDFSLSGESGKKTKQALEYLAVAVVDHDNLINDDIYLSVIRQAEALSNQKLWDEPESSLRNTRQEAVRKIHRNLEIRPPHHS